MSQQVTEGDMVEWEYGSGTIGSGTATGEVLETGLDKFGYDDVIKVDPGRGATHVRPEDLI